MIETKEVSTSWDMIRKIFEESVPFHKSLGFRVVGLETGTPRVHIDLQEKFVANFIRGNLHGGVISSLLDVIGGIVAFVDVTERKNIKTSEANSNSFPEWAPSTFESITRGRDSERYISLLPTSYVPEIR